MGYALKMNLKKRAQVVLETALVLVALAILLVGIMRIWAWFARQYTDRWSGYNSTRVDAGQVATYEAGGFVSDGYNKSDLNLF